jgi:hypothetical protein
MMQGIKLFKLKIVYTALLRVAFAAQRLPRFAEDAARVIRKGLKHRIVDCFTLDIELFYISCFCAAMICNHPVCFYASGIYCFRTQFI